MSDRMHCIPFRNLLDWVLGEWEESGSVFGCKKLYRAGGEGGLRPAPFMGRFLETPIGPAAGRTPSSRRTSPRPTSAAAACSSSRPCR